jgi:hypothetical protein
MLRPSGSGPEWGFTIMTPGKTRGKKHKVSGEPRRRRYELPPRNPTGQAPSGLANFYTIHTPGFTGGHHCFNPSGLAIQPQKKLSKKITSMPLCHNLNRNHKKPRRGEMIITLGKTRG